MTNCKAACYSFNQSKGSAVKTSKSPSRSTMSQVAQLAEVSTATVSYVVNNDPKAMTLTQATRDRVHQAVRTLNYRPNLQARGLRTQVSRSIAVVTDELTAVPYQNSAIRGMQERAWQDGFMISTLTTSGNAELAARAVHVVLERQFDAVVFTTSYTREVEVPVEFSRMPLVLLNCLSREATGERRNSVLPAERAGARSAAEILIEAGHTRIAFVNGLRETWAAGERHLGHRDALRAAGIPYDRSLVRWGNFQTDSGHRLATALLSRPEPPTGIVCGNDRMAVGVYYAAYQLGLRIPDDLSVIGYDDHTEFSGYAVPPMSTVSLPYYEMGYAAIDRLLALISDSSQASRVTEIACTPILRKSVGPPRQPGPASSASFSTPPSAMLRTERPLEPVT